jgi:hypothetical protein
MLRVAKWPRLFNDATGLDHDGQRGQAARPLRASLPHPYPCVSTERQSRGAPGQAKRRLQSSVVTHRR